MRTELQLSLTGSEAKAWLAGRGWKLISPDVQRLRLTADFAWTPTFVIGRIWHSPVTMEIIDNSEFEHVTVASFVIDGSIDLVADGRTRRVPVGAHYYSVGNTALQLRTRRPSSRLLIGVRSSLFDGLPAHRRTHAHSYRADASYHRALVASATAALHGHVRRNTTPYRYWSVGLENLLIAATLSGVDSDLDLPEPDTNTAPAQNSAESILAIIDEHAHDPSFSVQRAAALANLSRSQVHRLLETTDRTPAVHLRDARLRLAEAQLQDGTTSTVDFQRVALNSGFSSVRALREALRSREAHAFA